MIDDQTLRGAAHYLSHATRSALEGLATARRVPLESVMREVLHQHLDSPPTPRRLRLVIHNRERRNPSWH